MCVVNTNAKYHSAKAPEKCLRDADREKKNMYLEACLQQCKKFSLFIAYIDEILGVEAGSTLKRLDVCLAKQWSQP